MSDAFFSGGTAASLLATLAARPDAVLVSDETVHDFQLQPGDLLRLRLQSASDHRYHVVPFHYVVIVREFPTAPRDSFIVANASYVAHRTGTPAAQTLLGRQSRVTQFRGQLVESDLAERVTATVHPSSILRGEPDERDANFAAFVGDLRVVADLIDGRKPS